MVFSGLRFPSTNKTDRHDITEIVFTRVSSTNKSDRHDIAEILLSPVSSTNKNWPPRYNWNIVADHHDITEILCGFLHQ